MEATRDGTIAGLTPETLLEHTVEWRLVIRRLPELDIEREVVLPYQPAAVVATPDGTRAYLLAGHSQRPGVLMEVDLESRGTAGGGVPRLHRLPGAAMGLAATEDDVYVASPEAGSVWQLDRQGRVQRTIAVGKQPIWLAIGRG